MIYLLALSQFKSENADKNSKQDIFVNIALKVENISKIYKAEEIERIKNYFFLFKMGENPFVIQLKNTNLFPVFEIDKTVEFNKRVLPIDRLTKGCLYTPIFKEFIIIKGKIYAIPEEIFLSGNRE